MEQNTGKKKRAMIKLGQKVLIIFVDNSNLRNLNCLDLRDADETFHNSSQRIR